MYFSEGKKDDFSLFLETHYRGKYPVPKKAGWQFIALWVIMDSANVILKTEGPFMKRPVLKFSYNAPVTLTFALFSLLALALGHFAGGWTTTHLFSVYRCSLSDPLAFFRFFGHVLGHADLSHFMSNMLFILLLGPSVEDRFGSWNVLWAMLVTALITGLIYFIFFPGSALLGASGIVFMMILMASFGGTGDGVIPNTTILVAIFSLGGVLWNAIFKKNHVSELAHIVGGLCGMFIGFALGNRRRR